MQNKIVLLFSFLCFSCMAYAQEPNIVMTTTKAEGETIFITLASNESVNVTIDFGGHIVKGSIFSSLIGFIEPMGSSKTIKIYGNGITTFTCGNNKLSSVDVTQCPTLENLGCSFNQLTALDVSRCPNLQQLGCYNNQIELLDVTMCPALNNLDCRYNKIPLLDLSNCPLLTDVLCYNNQIKSLNINGCTVLKKINCSTNQISILDISTCNSLVHLNCSDNKLRFSSLPLKKTTWNYYSYALQTPIPIPEYISPGTEIDLSSEAVVDGKATTYTWKTTDGVTLSPGLDYSISNGITVFSGSVKGKIFCELENSYFPYLTGDFLLKTTEATMLSTQNINIPNDKPIEIYTIGRKLQITFHSMAQIRVYDLAGRQIANRISDVGECSIDLPQRGEYVVNITTSKQKTSCKVMAK